MSSGQEPRAWMKRVILGSRSLRSVSRFRASSAAVLMYHSVVPDPRERSDALGDLSHDEKTFRMQMEWLARDYHPIGLEEAVNRSRSDRDLARRSVLVTFDDGYADNYQLAMPILNRCGIAATFYVTVECIEKQKPPWPCRLRYAFRTTNVATWTDREGGKWGLNDAASRERAFLAACEFVASVGRQARNDFIALVEGDLRACLPTEAGPPMMTPEQIRAAALQGHAIGSHTMTHPNVAYLDSQEAVWELAESRRRLESTISSPVRHFAYPCPALSPHWSEATIAQCRAAGYESAVTTDAGVFRRGADLLRLPRIRPTKTVDGLRWNLECAFAGRATK